MRGKRKKNKLIIIISIIIILLVGIGYITYNYIQNNNNNLKKESLIKEINNHYNKFVKTNKETKLYNENNEEVGTVGKDVELSLNKENISEDTKYFKVITFDDSYYIKYQDVDKIDKLS